MLNTKFVFFCLATALLAGCSFDTSSLDSRACESDGDCPTNQLCTSGYCVGEGVAVGDTGVVDDGGVAVDGGPGSDVGTDAGPLPDSSPPDTGERECESGERQCNGEAVEVCNGAGRFEAVEECVVGDGCGPESPGCYCEEGECLSLVCEPRTRRCDGNVVLLCSEDGLSEIGTETCADGAVCSDGACVFVACEADSTFCEGETLVECDSEGQVTDSTDCTVSDAYCDDAASSCVPRVCTPSQRVCGGGLGDFSDRDIVECDGRGTELTLAETCAEDQLCSDGACVDLACEPGESVCVGPATVASCNDDGTSRNESRCDVGFYCDPDTADCVEQTCDPGDRICDGLQRVSICNERGAEYELLENCAEDWSCVEGVCVERVCPPGLAFCDAEGNAASCNSDGTAVSDIESCDFGCESGACVPSFCGDGILDAVAGEVCDDGNDNVCDGCVDCVPRTSLVLSDGLATGGSSSWVPGESSFFISFWVRVDSANGTIMGIGESADTDWVLVDVAGGFARGRFNLGGGDIVSTRSLTRIDDGEWHHVAFERFRQTIGFLYVDGRLHSISNPSFSRTSIDGTAGRIWVGSDGVTSSVEGAIDELQILSRNIAGSSYAPAPRYSVEADATIALYHFDDASGTAAMDDGPGGRDLEMSGALWTDATCFGSAESAIACGDGELAAWEECDDGGAADGDGCSVACRGETGCGSAIHFEAATSGGCYARIFQNLDDDDTRRTCGVLTGGRVTTIEDAAENEFLSALFSGDSWIGLNDRGGLFEEGEFRWDGGGASGYRNWADGEPNDGGFAGNEDCVEMRDDGRWNDIGCGSAQPGICEIY